MSVFSESIHLLGAVSAAGVLIRTSGSRGILAPPTRRWTSFVVDPGRPSRSMLAGNPGWLLHYSYAEDHGWEFSLYLRTALIATYDRGWDPWPSPGTLTCPTPLDELASMLGIVRLKQLKSIFQDEPPARRPHAVAPYDRALEFSHILGLSQVEWFSYHYALSQQPFLCDRCSVGSLESRKCLLCGAPPPKQKAVHTQPPVQSQRPHGPAFIAARQLLERMSDGGAIELSPETEVTDTLVSRLLVFLEDFADSKPVGRVFCEWLLNQPEIEEVFDDDRSLEAFFAPTPLDGRL